MRLQMSPRFAGAARPAARWLLGAVLLLPACAALPESVTSLDPEYRAHLERVAAVRELRHDFEALAATLRDATGSKESAIVALLYGSWLAERSRTLRAAIERLRAEPERQRAQPYYRRAAAAVAYYLRAVDHLDAAIKIARGETAKGNAHVLGLGVKLNIHYARAEWAKGDDALR